MATRAACVAALYDIHGNLPALEAVLAEVDSLGVDTVVVCGHTHVQFDRSIDRRRVVNAGSVAMPYQGEPGAYWALLSDIVELRRTEYHLGEAAVRIGATGYPGAVELLEMLREPPSVEEASSHFERIAVELER
jgi:diadenosine tetraphosphatase ApaH/serine/threonine PP2A family protein phosphatase